MQHVNGLIYSSFCTTFLSFPRRRVCVRTGSWFRLGSTIASWRSWAEPWMPSSGWVTAQSPTPPRGRSSTSELQRRWTVMEQWFHKDDSNCASEHVFFRNLLTEDVCLSGGPSDIRCSVPGGEGPEGREASGRVLHGAYSAGRRHNRHVVYPGGNVRAAGACHQVCTQALFLDWRRWLRYSDDLHWIDLVRVAQ